MPASQPKTQNFSNPETAAGKTGFYLFPDAESAEIQLHNMYGHLNRLVKKVSRNKEEEEKTNYGIRERVTRPFRRRSSAQSGIDQSISEEPEE